MHPEPSEAFVRRTRNPDVTSPQKVVRTEKKPGEYEFVGGKLVEVRRG